MSHLDRNTALYASAGAVPASADSIIEKALAVQDEIARDVRLREEDATTELAAMAGRSHEATAQQRRRVNVMERAEEAAVAALAQGVEGVRQAMRDTPSTLRPDGHQSHTFPNRDVYDGEWRNTTLHGHGRWTCPSSGLEYDGEWFLGVRAGNGTYRCRATNTSYVGRWYEGKRHGRGELTEPEGTYRGEFREDRFYGFGEYVYADGHRYRGEWADDRYDGTGTYHLPSGAKFEGEWRRGLLSGKAAATFDREGSETYHGEWTDGKRHGRGVLRSKDLTYNGEWAYDAWNGAGTCHWANGTRYQGEFVRGLPEGEGTMRQADGATYSGHFVAGRRHGRGVYTACHGRATFDGAWRDDKKHGPGVLSLKLAGSITGTWAADELHGKAVFRPTFGELATAVFNRGACVECVSEEIVVKVALSLGNRRGSAAEGGGNGAGVDGDGAPAEDHRPGDDDGGSANGSVPRLAVAAPS